MNTNRRSLIQSVLAMLFAPFKAKAATGIVVTVNGRRFENATKLDIDIAVPAEGAKAQSFSIRVHGGELTVDNSPLPAALFDFSGSSKISLNCQARNPLTDPCYPALKMVGGKA